VALGAPACPKPGGGRFPNTEGRLLHHDAIPSEESLRAIHSAAEHGCHQAKDESCKTGRTTPASYAGTESSSPIEHTLTTHTPPHHQPDCPGGISNPCQPRSPGSGAHLPTSSVSRQNFHAWHPCLPCTSAPNQRTESSNPCLPRGLLPIPRTRAEWEDSYKPTNQNSKNRKPGIRPLWEWGPARLKEGKLERLRGFWALRSCWLDLTLCTLEIGGILDVELSAVNSHDVPVCIALLLAQTIGDGRRRPYCTVQR
jgi:hypothetical protein